MSKWEVWSVDLGNGNAVGVEQGTEKQAKAGADRRNAAAARLGMPGTGFIALPCGLGPDYGDLARLRQVAEDTAREKAAQEKAALAAVREEAAHVYEFTLTVTLRAWNEADARKDLDRVIKVSHRIERVRERVRGLEGGTS